MHHRRVPPVNFLDPPRDVRRVGDKAVDARGALHVPAAYVMQHQPRRRRLRAAQQPRLAQILVLQIPGVADRRVAVTHVQLVRAGEHAFRHRMAAGNHQVIAAHIQLLDRQWHQRQIAPITRARTRQLLDETGGRAFAEQPGAIFIGQEIHHREQIGVRKQCANLAQHALRSGVGHQPIMHHRDAHKESCSGKALARR